VRVGTKIVVQTLTLNTRHYLAAHHQSADVGTGRFLHKLLHQNITFRIYRRRLLDENRWRAARYGIDGKMIDFGKEAEVDERSLLNELLDFVSTEIKELGSEREMAHIERIIREGTGADRQLAAWERTQDTKAVVDHIVVETYEGLSLP